MLAAGVGVKVVSETLGHSNTRITRDIYQSVFPEVAKDAAETAAGLVPIQRKAQAEKAAKDKKDRKKKAKKKTKATKA